MVDPSKGLIEMRLTSARKSIPARPSGPPALPLSGDAGRERKPAWLPLSRRVVRSALGGLALAMAAATSAALVPAPVWAQTNPMRTLPANGKRAILTQYYDRDRVVVLDGEPRRLAPGAVIYDTNNRTILPGFLPASADVVYTSENLTGFVSRIYLLTPREQQLLNEAKR